MTRGRKDWLGRERRREEKDLRERGRTEGEVVIMVRKKRRRRRRGNKIRERGTMGGDRREGKNNRV